MFVSDSGKLTRSQAAAKFVAYHFEGREVGQWRGDCFQLVDGVKWYRVGITAIGWDVSEADRTPTKA